jgi:thiamine pyrophosphokinase
VYEAVVILAGGAAPPAWLAGELPSRLFVIAADSGLDHARRLGLEVNLIVGDLDSVGADVLASYPDVRIERHSPDKDQTDLELAIDAASEIDAGQIIVVGGSGGRIDHLLANAALITSDRFAGLEISWLTAEARSHVVRSAMTIHGSTGDLVSLIPYGGSAAGVTTTGLRWPLQSEVLPSGTTRGISNAMTGPVARVSLTEGVLLVTHIPSDLG